MTAAKFREDTPEGTQAQERVKGERDFARNGVAVKTSRAKRKLEGRRGRVKPIGP